MATYAWGTETCPACDGSGWNYCEQCEPACEHDRPCSKCNGNKEVPAKLEGLQLVAVCLVGVRVFRTAREARQAIETRAMGGQE